MSSPHESGHPRKKPEPRIVRVAGRAGSADPPEPADAPFALDRLSALTHDLNNLLDGSLRCLGLARASLAAAQTPKQSIELALKQIDTAHAAMERMAGMVHAAMSSGAGPVLNAALEGTGLSLADAATHASDVMALFAAERRVRVSTDIDPAAATIAAGPIYPVVLNGVRNAIEAVARTNAPGEVLVRLRLDPAPARRLVLEVIDDGPGPGPRSGMIREQAFSSMPPREGLGLAIAAGIARQTRGILSLEPRTDRADKARPGAVLRLVCPMSDHPTWWTT